MILNMHGQPCDPDPVVQFVSLKDYNLLVEAHNALYHKFTKLQRRVEKLESKPKPIWRRWF